MTDSSTMSMNQNDDHEEEVNVTSLNQNRINNSNSDGTVTSTNNVSSVPKEFEGKLSFIYEAWRKSPDYVHIPQENIIKIAEGLKEAVRRSETYDPAFISMILKNPELYSKLFFLSHAKPYDRKVGGSNILSTQMEWAGMSSSKEGLPFSPYFQVVLGSNDKPLNTTIPPSGWFLGSQQNIKDIAKGTFVPDYMTMYKNDKNSISHAYSLTVNVEPSSHPEIVSLMTNFDRLALYAFSSHPKLVLPEGQDHSFLLEKVRPLLSPADKNVAEHPFHPLWQKTKLCYLNVTCNFYTDDIEYNSRANKRKPSFQTKVFLRTPNADGTYSDKPGTQFDLFNHVEHSRKHRYGKSLIIHGAVTTVEHAVQPKFGAVFEASVIYILPFKAVDAIDGSEFTNGVVSVEESRERLNSLFGASGVKQLSALPFNSEASTFSSSNTMQQSDNNNNNNNNNNNDNNLSNSTIKQPQHETQQSGSQNHQNNVDINDNDKKRKRDDQTENPSSSDNDTDNALDDFNPDLVTNKKQKLEEESSV